MLSLVTAILLTPAAQNPSTMIRPVTVVGKIREVAAGPAGRPQPILVAGSKHYVLRALAPELRVELRRLAGLQVKITGVTGDPRIEAGHDHVLVDRYTIVEISPGVVPRVGRLALLRVGRQKRLVFVDESGQADLLPVGWSQRLHRHAGAKVWMVGNRDSDGSFRPQRFAILRTAASGKTRRSSKVSP